MATALDKIKWRAHLIKKRYYLVKGFSDGSVKFYDDELIKELRHIYYGGIPCSIMILCKGLCDGYCLDRSVMITNGFGDDDFNIVLADVDSIKLNPEYIDKYSGSEEQWAYHSFAERTLSDGSVWVYDTSSGLVIKKDLYYKIESPSVYSSGVKSKSETLQYREPLYKTEDTIGDDMYAAVLSMPNIKLVASLDDYIYADALKREIDLFEQSDLYTAARREIEADSQQKF